MKREPVTAPSGRVYQWAQPPRRVHWRHGRAGRTFAAKVEEIAEAAKGESVPVSDEEKGERVIEAMSDAELARLEAYADDVLTAGLGQPPSDMPEIDYWFFFGRSVYGVKEMKVETKEGAMSVEELENFPEKPGLPSDEPDVPNIQRKRLGEDGDSRPVAA